MFIKNDIKEISSLVAITPNLFQELENVEKNLLSSKEFITNKIDNNIFQITWEGREFKIFVSHITNIQENTNNFIGRNHYLNPEDQNFVKESNDGIEVAMIYDDDLLSSFHLHLKLIYTISPTLRAVLDMSSFSFLNKHWVRMASNSVIPPNPDYLVNVHGVLMEDNTGWYHTHGLKRCGFNDIEIKGFPREDGELYYPLIETISKNLITGTLGDNLEEYEVFWGVQNYPLTFVKTTNSNEEDEFHCDNFELKIYCSEEDCNNKMPSDITILKESLENNPIFYINDIETRRMSILAKEREHFIYDFLNKKDTAILIKFGLDTDNPEENGEKEHLWFEISDINEETYTGKLINEPYFISGVHEGDILEIDKDRMTDWIIYTPNARITPDTTYLIEEMITFNN